jgi:REP element-mobilizing transposase RayT
MKDSKELGLLKGKSVYLIFTHKSKMRLRYSEGHFWSSGNCPITVEYSILDTTNHCIKNQQEHYNVAFA